MQKLNLQQLPDIFKEVVTASYDSTKNELTLTSVKGDKTLIELSPKDNFILDVTYSTTTHKLTVEYLDNTTKDLDLSELYAIYTGVDGDEIKVDIDTDNKITATIKAGAVTRAKLATAVTDELDSLRTDVDDNRDNIAINKGNIDTNKKDIADLKNSIASQKSTDSAGQGDIAVLPLVDSANDTWQRIEVLADADSEAYADNLPAGYPLSGPQYSYLNKKFNRIKVNVVVPRMG